ncbi:hypothetical protein [Amycolatopsis sp. lyj-109]|uniref:hypothetical protein n=1 Tax=Amycolatopsis sp. lyj-109 TaxID=2789287 RepID=UPI00397BC20C
MNVVEQVATKLSAEEGAIQPLEFSGIETPVSCATFDVYRIGWAALHAAEAATDHRAANAAAAALMRAHGFGGYDNVAGLPAQGAVSFGDQSTDDLIALRSSWA